MFCQARRDSVDINYAKKYHIHFPRTPYIKWITKTFRFLHWPLQFTANVQTLCHLPFQCIISWTHVPLNNQSIFFPVKIVRKPQNNFALQRKGSEHNIRFFEQIVWSMGSDSGRREKVSYGRACGVCGNSIRFLSPPTERNSMVNPLKDIAKNTTMIIFYILHWIRLNSMQLYYSSTVQSTDILLIIPTTLFEPNHL